MIGRVRYAIPSSPPRRKPGWWRWRAGRPRSWVIPTSCGRPGCSPRPFERAQAEYWTAFVAQYQRASAELFATLPTEAERTALVYASVAEFERARAEWLESFVAGGTVPE